MDTSFKNILFSAFILLTGLLAGCGDGSPEQAMNKAVAFARNGEWGKAAKIADRLARRNPNLAAAHVLRAVTSERSGDRQSALDAARRAVEADPDDFVTQYTLARLYAAEPARSSEAEKALFRAWAKRVKDVRVKILLCNVAMESNSPRSFQYLRNLERVPEYAHSAQLHNQFAVNYVRNRRYREAYNSFKKAMYWGKNDPAILLNAARFYDDCYHNRRLSRYIGKKDVAALYKSYLDHAGEDASGKVEAAARLSKIQGKTGV